MNLQLISALITAQFWVNINLHNNRNCIPLQLAENKERSNSLKTKVKVINSFCSAALLMFHSSLGRELDKAGSLTVNNKNVQTDRRQKLRQTTACVFKSMTFLYNISFAPQYSHLPHEASAYNQICNLSKGRKTDHLAKPQYFLARRK